MVLEKNLSSFIVLNDDPLSVALDRITYNKSGFVIVVSRNGIPEGILTDGDFRRWLLTATNKNLDQPAISVCNKSFISAFENSSAEDISEKFSGQISFIPLLDNKGRLVAIATNKKHVFNIGSFIVAESNPTFIIAEIGNNHNGSLELAKKLIDEAVNAGADCAKFQMRSMNALYRNTDAGEDLGAEYTLDLLAKFQLSNEELFTAFDYCYSKNILPLCTPFDEESLFHLENYGLKGYKLASADLTNHDLIIKMCETRKPIICSTGMSSETEVSAAVKLMRSYGASFALLHCNSTYPAPYKDINLNYLPHLKRLGHDCEIGYSGHERGYMVPIAAVAKGARIIEKHFTLDRNMEGNDHRVSLLPDEFEAMVKSIRAVEQSLGSSDLRQITQGEMMNREFLAKSVIASRDIKTGDIISESHLDIKSPGKGLAPYRKNELLGKIAKRDIPAGDFFFENDIDEIVVTSKEYAFKRPFGIPVRYHDFKQIICKSNFDLLEFHFSYKDMEVDAVSFLDPAGYEMDLVIHSPELFAGDHIMDLCSDNLEYRSRSIAELQRVIDITRSLKPFFKKAVRPKIIINAGGASQDHPISIVSRLEKYQSIAYAFKELDMEGVEIIPQTMPPFPWHFGGQRFHNLFMEADDIVRFCASNNTRICLDISHSKLVCNHNHESFKEFLEKVAPYTAHIHMVDASGVDGEGLQINEGDIDFALVASVLNQYCPDASFIPEIWQGHKNDCQGFWIALERLEKYF
jgi:sialic acid synthase SpsE/sugar phosphate isomerase/epimerase